MLTTKNIAENVSMFEVAEQAVLSFLIIVAILEVIVFCRFIIKNISKLIDVYIITGKFFVKSNKKHEIKFQTIYKSSTNDNYDNPLFLIPAYARKEKNISYPFVFNKNK